MSETIEGLKALAKSLRETARAQGETVSHSQALEGVAKAHGFKDWNTAAAMLPHAPVGLTIDEVVREFRALRVEVDRHAYHRANWYESAEYTDWCARMNELLARIMDGFEPYTVAALMRYSVYVLKNPMSIVTLSNWKRFVHEYRHIVMGETEKFMALFEKMFPGAKPEGRPDVKPEPFTYGPLVRAIQTIMKGNPGLTEDEVIEILKKCGRPLNEATARGLYRKGYAHLSREDQILHVVSTPGYQPR